MSKEALVIILDIGKSMGDVGDNGGHETKLDKAKAAFRLMIQQKLLFGYKQDVCCVLLFNSKNTKNACHEEYGGYDLIEEYFELGTPNLQLLECIDNVQCNLNGTTGDALDALLVGAQIIINYVGKKKYRKRVFMITDGSTAINDIDQLNDIANSFMNESIDFNCIGIGFGEEKEKENENTTEYNSFNDIEIIHHHRRNDIQIKNEKILRYFSDMVNGNIVTGISAIKMMSDLRTKSVLMRPTYQGPFAITSALSINVKLYCRCREQTLPSLKKTSIIGTESGKVQMDRLYLNKFRGDNDDEEVEEDERVKSYLYGKERIPFNENDEIRLNYKSGDKHFECLGFINNKKIKRHQFMATTTIVIADPLSPRSQYCLSAFVRACHEKNINVLCRLVSRKNASPKYVILQPRIKTNKEIFILNELPFYEDIRKFPFASFNIKKNYMPSKEQINCCKSLIQSLSLMEAQIDEDGDKIESLKPQNTFNPILQRFYQNIQCRALDEKCDIQPLDPMIKKYLEPDPIMFNNQNTKKCMKNFENLFPTKLIPKKQVKKERKHWNEITDELDNLMGDMGDFGIDNDENNENKNTKQENDTIDIEMKTDDANELLNIQVEKITEIGTVNPKNDFNILLSNRSSADLFDKLSIAYWKIINNIIDNSMGNFAFQKALDNIIHLKQCSIKEEEPLLFNKELIKFKIKYKEKKKDLWNMLVKNNIKLIDISDFDKLNLPHGLTITKKESNEFLTQQVEEKPQVMKIEEDSDDDFDDLV